MQYKLVLAAPTVDELPLGESMGCRQQLVLALSYLFIIRKKNSSSVLVLFPCRGVGGGGEAVEMESPELHDV